MAKFLDERGLVARMTEFLDVQDKASVRVASHEIGGDLDPQYSTENYMREFRNKEFYGTLFPELETLKEVIARRRTFSLPLAPTIGYPQQAREESAARRVAREQFERRDIWGGDDRKESEPPLPPPQIMGRDAAGTITFTTYSEERLFGGLSVWGRLKARYALFCSPGFIKEAEAIASNLHAKIGRIRQALLRPYDATYPLQDLRDREVRLIRLAEEGRAINNAVKESYRAFGAFTGSLKKWERICFRIALAWQNFWRAQGVPEKRPFEMPQDVLHRVENRSVSAELPPVIFPRFMSHGCTYEVRAIVDRERYCTQFALYLLGGEPDAPRPTKMGGVEFHYEWGAPGRGDYREEDSDFGSGPLGKRSLHANFQIDTIHSETYEQLIQIIVEVFAREKDTSLRLHTSRGELLYACAGGLSSYYGERERDAIMAEVQEARLQGQAYPAWKDRSSQTCYLEKMAVRAEDREEASEEERRAITQFLRRGEGGWIYTAQSFGDEPRTWEATIASNPMLGQGAGQILPFYIVKDGRKFESTPS